MSVILKPSASDPKVELQLMCAYTTPEGLERLIKALTVAKNWLKDAKK